MGLRVKEGQKQHQRKNKKRRYNTHTHTLPRNNAFRLKQKAMALRYLIDKLSVYLCERNNSSVVLRQAG